MCTSNCSKNTLSVRFRTVGLQTPLKTDNTESPFHWASNPLNKHVNPELAWAVERSYTFTHESLRLAKFNQPEEIKVKGKERPII